MNVIRPTDDELHNLHPSSIEIYEDANGLYLLIHDDDGPSILLSGIWTGVEDALTDCVLLADWIDSVPKCDRWYWRDVPVDDLTRVAIYRDEPENPTWVTRVAAYRDDRLYIDYDALGPAAEQYLGVADEETTP